MILAKITLPPPPRTFQRSNNNIEIKFTKTNQTPSKGNEVTFTELLRRDHSENILPAANSNTATWHVIGYNDKPTTIPRHGISGMINRENGGSELGLTGKMREQIEKGNYEEFSTEPPSEETVNTCMYFFGGTREETIAILNKAKQKNKVKNKKLNNTKASNGMSYPEAKRTYMRLYEKYILATRVTCPGADGNLSYVDVDSSRLKEKMSPADLELYEKAEAAMAELEQNKELMSLYENSRTASLESYFSISHNSDGINVREWKGTKYVKEVPYYE